MEKQDLNENRVDEELKMNGTGGKTAAPYAWIVRGIHPASANSFPRQNGCRASEILGVEVFVVKTLFPASPSDTITGASGSAGSVRGKIERWEKGDTPFPISITGTEVTGEVHWVGTGNRKRGRGVKEEAELGMIGQRDIKKSCLQRC